MTPAPAGSEPNGFEMGPEFYLFGLGVLATLLVAGIFLWLLSQRSREGGTNDTLDHPRESGDE